jgi:hypothetical protein
LCCTHTKKQTNKQIEIDICETSAMFQNMKGLALRDSFLWTLLNSQHAVFTQFSSRASSETSERKHSCSLTLRFKCISLKVETYNALTSMWLLTSTKLAGTHQLFIGMNTDWKAAHNIVIQLQCIELMHLQMH